MVLKTKEIPFWHLIGYTRKDGQIEYTNDFTFRVKYNHQSTNLLATIGRDFSVHYSMRVEFRNQPMFNTKKQFTIKIPNNFRYQLLVNIELCPAIYGHLFKGENNTLVFHPIIIDDRINIGVVEEHPFELDEYPHVSINEYYLLRQLKTNPLLSLLSGGTRIHRLRARTYRVTIAFKIYDATPPTSFISY